MVIIEVGDGNGRRIVEGPTTRPFVPSEIGVPARVIAGPLAINVVPAIAMPFKEMVRGRSAAFVTVADMGGGFGRKLWAVEAPKTRSPLECSAIGVLEIVIRPFPRERYCPSTRTALEEDAACTTCPPIVVVKGAPSLAGSIPADVWLLESPPSC